MELVSLLYPNCTEEELLYVFPNLNSVTRVLRNTRLESTQKIAELKACLEREGAKELKHNLWLIFNDDSEPSVHHHFCKEYTKEFRDFCLQIPCANLIHFKCISTQDKLLTLEQRNVTKSQIIMMMRSCVRRAPTGPIFEWLLTRLREHKLMLKPEFLRSVFSRQPNPPAYMFHMVLDATDHVSPVAAIPWAMRQRSSECMARITRHPLFDAKETVLTLSTQTCAAEPLAFVVLHKHQWRVRFGRGQKIHSQAAALIASLKNTELHHHDDIMLRICMYFYIQSGVKTYICP